MAEESDGIGDEFDGQMRVALTIAAQMAERFARLREELARNAQARTEQQTKELQARFDAERGAARASVAPVHQSEWWKDASVDDIATAYETSEAWRGVDPEMERTADHMREQLRERYGIDVNNLDADPAAVQDARDKAEQERGAAAENRGESAKEYGEAAALVTVADQLDRQAEERDRENERAEHANDEPAEGQSRDELAPKEPAEAQSAEELTAKADVTRDDAANTYDSAGRRDAFAADMEKKGVDPEALRARLLADRDNGTHPDAAVKDKPGKQPKARNSKKNAGLQRERDSLSR